MGNIGIGTTNPLEHISVYHNSRDVLNNITNSNNVRLQSKAKYLNVSDIIKKRGA